MVISRQAKLVGQWVGLHESFGYILEICPPEKFVTVYIPRNRVESLFCSDASAAEKSVFKPS